MIHERGFNGFNQGVAQLQDTGNAVLGGKFMPDSDFFTNHGSHAAPLMPLRDRDLKVLIELFNQDEIDEIEADIIGNLMRRAPEPCWEDEALDFLKEYL